VTAHQAPPLVHDAAMAASFWQYLFDNEWRQRQDIESLRDRLDTGSSAQAGLAASASVGALRQQIHELSATVMILVDLLAEAGALDREKLRARVEGVLENSRVEPTPMPDPWTPAAAAAKRPEVGGDPYRDSLQAPATVVCASCGRTVPERLTVITAEGVICDACAATKR
jgi:hypothetical protein